MTCVRKEPGLEVSPTSIPHFDGRRAATEPMNDVARHTTMVDGLPVAMLAFKGCCHLGRDMRFFIGCEELLTPLFRSCLYSSTLAHKRQLCPFGHGFLFAHGHLDG
jgi:hypothetical protein